MRIGYVAHHDQANSNDDEGAIYFALEKLGHTVERLRESRGYVAHKLNCDFVLCHHWNDFDAIKRIKKPKVFWCFDLIEYPLDPTLRARNEQRKSWAKTMTDICDLGFMTDGDWVADDQSGKLHWLMQGADERVVGRGTPNQPTIPILFTGSYRGGGVGRESFFSEMKARYGNEFHHVQKSHGRELADIIASSSIVVAPDHPATDNYWSNRVFNTLGFGGFLLHPRCKKLEMMYETGVEIDYYDSREELHEKIEFHSASPDTTKAIGHYGYLRTMKEHLYRHRVERLVKVVQERLF